MTVHVLTDLRRDLTRFRAQVRLGQLSADQAEAWFTRLEGHLDDVDAYLMMARLNEAGETLQLTDLRRPAFHQPGRRTPNTRHLTVVDGGAA